MRESIAQIVALLIIAACVHQTISTPTVPLNNDGTQIKVAENVESTNPDSSHLRVDTEAGPIGESKIKPRKGVFQNATQTPEDNAGKLDKSSVELTHGVDDKPILVNATTTKMTSQKDIAKEESSEVKKVSDPTNDSPAVKMNTTASNKSPIISNVTIPVVEIVDDASNTNLTSKVFNSTPSNKISTTKQKAEVTPATSTTTTTTTTTSTTSSTTSTTTTTTTTPKPTTKAPKKPTITYSVEDVPSLLDLSKTPNKASVSPTSGKLAVEEPEQPIAQPSQEFIEDSSHVGGHGDIVIPVVALIFAVPMLLGIITVLFRRVRDYWSTRHYRRMDFLVDGMYNY